MKIGQMVFKGMAPRVAPELLPDNAAQLAINCKLNSGNLESWNHFVTEKLLAGAGVAKTIYWLKDRWLSWNEVVDVARGVIAGDTTYRTYLTCPALYTGPRFTNYALATTGAEPYPVVTRPLGVPPPSVAGTLAAGVDSTPTTFSIDITDAGDQLATAWITSPVVPFSD